MFEVGDVVLHQDDDLPQTVTDVVPMLTAMGWAVQFVRTARRFRPATEFTRTPLRVIGADK